MHLGAARNVGMITIELEEVIIQTVPYAGFPTAINAVNTRRSRLSSRTKQPPDTMVGSRKDFAGLLRALGAGSWRLVVGSNAVSE